LICPSRNEENTITAPVAGDTQPSRFVLIMPPRDGRDLQGNQKEEERKNKWSCTTISNLA
jgi:hypothetical protein